MTYCRALLHVAVLAGVVCADLAGSGIAKDQTRSQQPPALDELDLLKYSPTDVRKLVTKGQDLLTKYDQAVSGGVEGRAALDYLEKNGATKWVCALLHEKKAQIWLRPLAVQALGRMKDPGAVPSILDALHSSVGEAEKAEGNGEDAGSRWAFQLRAVTAVETLLGRDLVDQKALFKEAPDYHDMIDEGFLSALREFSKKARTAFEELKKQEASPPK